MESLGGIVDAQALREAAAVSTISSNSAIHWKCLIPLNLCCCMEVLWEKAESFSIHYLEYVKKAPVRGHSPILMKTHKRRIASGPESFPYHSSMGEVPPYSGEMLS